MFYLQDGTSVVDEADQGVIATGSLVRLQSFGDADAWEVMIVSSAESDPESDRISDQCPIGEALLGRRPGDTVLVEVPSGTVQYRVIAVSSAASSSALDCVP
jgi:transcription elongation factor GreA